MFQAAVGNEPSTLSNGITKRCRDLIFLQTCVSLFVRCLSFYGLGYIEYEHYKIGKKIFGSMKSSSKCLGPNVGV